MDKLEITNNEELATMKEYLNFLNKEEIVYPDNIYSKALKNECKKLLDEAFNKLKEWKWWAIYIIPKLIETNILNINEIRENYTNIYRWCLKDIFRYARRNDYYYAIKGIPERLNLNILSKEKIKQEFTIDLTQFLEELYSKYICKTQDLKRNSEKHRIYREYWEIPKKIINIWIWSKDDIKEMWKLKMLRQFLWDYKDANNYNQSQIRLKYRDETSERYRQMDDVNKYDLIWKLFEKYENTYFKIFGKNEKDLFKHTLREIFEAAESHSNIIAYIPELLKLWSLDESDTDFCKELLDIAFKHNRTTVIPPLINLKIMDENEIKFLYKDQYKDLLWMAFEFQDKAENISNLLELPILDGNDKDFCNNLLNNQLNVLTKNIEVRWIIRKEDTELISKIINTKVFNNDEITNIYEQTLKMCFKKANTYLNKYKNEWQDENNRYDNSLHIFYRYLEVAIRIINSKSNLIETNNENFLDKWTYINLINRFLDPELMRERIYSSSTLNMAYDLINLNILSKEEFKEKYGKTCINTIKDTQILEEIGKEHDEDLLFSRYSLIESFIKRDIFNKSDARFLQEFFYMIKDKYWWREYDKLIEILFNIINLEIRDEEQRKSLCKNLLKSILKTWLDDKYSEEALIKLINLNNLDLNEIQEICKEEFSQQISTSSNKKNEEDENGENEDSGDENNNNIANSYEVLLKLSKLLKLNILNNNDLQAIYSKYKRRYQQSLITNFQNIKKNYDLKKDFWCIDRLPDLLEIKSMLEDNRDVTVLEYLREDTVEIPNNIDFRFLSFLEKNKKKLIPEDMNFLLHGYKEFLTEEELEFIYSNLDYEQFKKIIGKDYQEIWKIKKRWYPREEQNKLTKLEWYFWEDVWTYFVDKIPSNKLIKNRFKDPHNALLNVNEIINLAQHLENKWISKKTFIKNYLWTAGDRNNWYQQLNNFLEKTQPDRQKKVPGRKSRIENEIKDPYWLKDSDFLNYANEILDKESTWELYKNLDELESILTVLNMLHEKENLMKLSSIANTSDPQSKKLYEYFKSAIYHPRTKPIIIDMYENPQKFLGLDDTTFRDLRKIHQSKKPSNMVENFEYLDFNAKDLISCLPLWIYDKLSYFKPFEMKFYITNNEVYSQNEIEDEIIKFLNLSDQKKITNIIKKIKESWDETMRYQLWENDKEYFKNQLLKQYNIENLIWIFVNLWYSEFNKYKELKLMTAKISPKSDPNNWFNGFNCDSLAEWHGKKVVAMFNPYCTDFCIYEWDQDPKEDNLKVTSRVTLNRAIPENFKTLFEKIKNETTYDIASIIWDKFEDYKDPNEYVITMDNIEANPNFGRKNEEIVRKMYEKFFSEYVRQNPISPNWIPINTSKFYSWVNYNKLNILKDRVPNESLPVFVNAYSDNSESYSLQWDLDAWEQKEKQKKVWIYPLSIEDVIQISYMEWKIYPSSMKDHLWNLQHEITASILNNTLKWRENLSFTRYNEEWKIWWYILAYQWITKERKPWIYISDFAIDEKERWTAWVQMIFHRIQQVKKYYPDMQIFTRARKNTSYRMIKSLTEREWYNITKDYIERDWGEDFHRVIIKPSNTK